MKEVQKSHVIIKPLFLHKSVILSTKSATELTLTMLPLLVKEIIFGNVCVLKRAWYSVMRRNADNTEFRHTGCQCTKSYNSQ